MALDPRALVRLTLFVDLALQAERHRAKAGQALDFPGQMRLVGIAAGHRGQGERALTVEESSKSDYALMLLGPEAAVLDKQATKVSDR
jgi:hypothetical protein